MKRARKLNALPIRQTLVALLLALAIASAQGQSRAPKSTEGDIALELFGLIAEQSSCSDYAVAWLESATQQLHYRCIETLPMAQRFSPTVSTEIKFLIEILRAKSAYRQRFGNAGLRRPLSLLAYLLVNFRGKTNLHHASSPVLLYGPMVQSDGSDTKD